MPTREFTNPPRGGRGGGGRMDGGGPLAAAPRIRSASILPLTAEQRAGCAARRSRSWRSRRRAAALAQGTLFLGLPFLEIGGESAFRFDIPGMKLLVFGGVVWIEEFFLVLAAVIAFSLFALGATVVFGRIWCGWICPQTVIPELAAWAASPLPPGFRKAGRSIILVPLSALVSLSLIAWFLPPASVVGGLARSPVVLGFFLVQGALVYGMAALAGTRFCKSVCPYAMVQNVLFDRDTLRVAFDRERAASCLRCDACVRACPAGIDIRDGDRRECVACASCIDACRTATAAGGIAPFVAYRGKIARGRTAALAAASAAAALGFFVLAQGRPAVAVEFQWAGRGAGSGINRYAYSVRNRLDGPVRLALGVEGGARLIGDRTVRVGPRSRARGEVAARRDGEIDGSVTFTASGDGVAIRSRAAFP